jgi:hypothetical protein
MTYASTPIKPDNPAENKFFFLCQTKGCEAVINPEFPVSEKNPSPKWCRDCQSKEVRAEIGKNYAERIPKI